MISMLYLEMKLLRKRKIIAIAMVLLPVYSLLISLLIPDIDPAIMLFLPLLLGWFLTSSTIISMKRYRQFEALFSLSVTPKDILLGNLLFLGIYYICVFVIYLPRIAIACPIEFRILFLLALLLMAAKGLASYLSMLIRRIHLIQWAVMLAYVGAIFGWRYIQAIAGHPYVWIVLPISLIAIAISYLMATRLSKERVILSSE